MGKEIASLSLTVGRTGNKHKDKNNEHLQNTEATTMRVSPLSNCFWKKEGVHSRIAMAQVKNSVEKRQRWKGGNSQEAVNRNEKVES